MATNHHIDQRAGQHFARSQLGLVEWVAIGVPVLILLWLAVPRLPQGACFGDSGGLQLAAATWGITHPPGYVVYASILHMLTWILPFDPAYDVSLSCLASGLGVVAMCTLLQIRLGVNAWLASGVSLLFTAHPRVWSNFLAPEVYMLTLLFEVTAIYWLVRFTMTRQRGFLYAAGLCLGMALASRPPVLLLLPFVAVAIALYFRRHRSSAEWSRRTVVAALGMMIAPILYAGLYIVVRDRPDTPFNYIEQYNAEMHVIPSSDGGFQARSERMFWLISAAQFRGQMGNTWSGLVRKVRWLGDELWRWLGSFRPGHGGVLLTVWVLIMLSGIRWVWSQNRLAMILLAGLACQSIVFVCLYRIYGDAADTLPLLFSCTVFGGACLSTMLRLFTKRTRRITSVIALVMAVVFTLWHVPTRSETGRAADATTFLRKFDMPTLAPDTVICSTWGTSTPLWYAKHLLNKRQDITIINASPTAWVQMTKTLRHRPIVVVESTGVWHDANW